MTAPLPIPVILNARAGACQKQDRRAELKQLFAAAGLAVDLHLAQTGQALTQLLRQARDAGHPLVVVGGGDGTLSTAAQLLVGSKTALAVLPLGTLNHFAKALHLPMDLAGAIAVIATGEVQQIDVGDVNGRVFLNNSSIGLYPRLVHQRQLHEKLGENKWYAFFWAMLAVFRRLPSLHLRFRARQRQWTLVTPLVFIGNNEYDLRAFHMGARVSLQDGRLGLYALRHCGRLGMLRLAVDALFGRLQSARDFQAMPVRDVWINARHHHLPVATDGEVNVMATPLHYSSRPGALRVLAPAAAVGLTAPQDAAAPASPDRFAGSPAIQADRE